MSKYERQLVVVGSLQDGDTFELPGRSGSICRVTFTSMRRDEHAHIRIIGYDILEGPLHMPMIFLPLNYEVILLTPTTTFVELSGKDWVNSLTEHHGVTG